MKPSRQIYLASYLGIFLGFLRRFMDRILVPVGREYSVYVFLGVGNEEAVRVYRSTSYRKARKVMSEMEDHEWNPEFLTIMSDRPKFRVYELMSDIVRMIYDEDIVEELMQIVKNNL